MAEENLNIIQKLAKVRGIADFVKKDKKGFNYTYADITAILAKVKAGMQKYGVTLIPNIVPGTTKIQQIVSKDTKFDKAGNAYEKVTTEMLVDADMVFLIKDPDQVRSVERMVFIRPLQKDLHQI